MKNIVSCCLSHVGVWEKISKLKDPCFVFEDDCTFINESAKNYFKNFKPPPDFDILWFNGNVTDRPGTATGSNYQFKLYHGDNTAESYMITPKFAGELVDAIKNDLGASDTHMMLYVKKFNKKSYRLFPPLFCQVDRTDTNIQV